MQFPIFHDVHIFQFRLNCGSSSETIDKSTVDKSGPKLKIFSILVTWYKPRSNTFVVKIWWYVNMIENDYTKNALFVKFSFNFAFLIVSGVKLHFLRTSAKKNLVKMAIWTLDFHANLSLLCKIISVNKTIE